MMIRAAPPALPDPPDPNDPANTVNGPLSGVSGGPYAGGVLIKKEADVGWTKPVNEFIAQFECTGGERTVTKAFPISIGESLHGPISGTQTQGIIDAINDVKPKDKTVKLSTTVSGDPAKITTWTLTGIEYTRTTYDVYVITQAVPAMERLVGYIVIDTPKALDTSKEEKPCPPPPTPMIELGTGYAEGNNPPPNSFFDIFFNILPDDGIPPFFDYGKVYIYTGGALYGGTDVRPGETVSFEVPPGTYTVSGEIGVFGLHFTIPGQTVSPPAGQNIVGMIIEVTLTVIEIVWVIIIIIVFVIILVAYFILRRLFGGRGGETQPPQTAPTEPTTPGQTPPSAEEPEEEVDRGGQS
ncbi:MAG: hypothetical protein HY296_05125 [Thaumarchaeota archaeon]|nr:hypothetical protein [Nitrososphaerota archaeon]